MKIFHQLMAIRSFEGDRLPKFLSLEDLGIIYSIGSREAYGEALPNKTLYRRGMASAATLTRRLKRLKELGLVVAEPHPKDKRMVVLRLSRELVSAYTEYEKILMSSSDQADTAERPYQEARMVLS